MKKREAAPVYAFYNGKVVDMGYIPDPKRRFSFAGMRVLDNAASGYVIDGARVYSVSHAYRSAKVVTGDAADAVLAEVVANLNQGGS
jgi:hypothetical protein